MGNMTARQQAMLKTQPQLGQTDTNLHKRSLSWNNSIIHPPTRSGNLKPQAMARITKWARSPEPSLFACQVREMFLRQPESVRPRLPPPFYTSGERIDTERLLGWAGRQCEWVDSYWTYTLDECVSVRVCGRNRLLIEQVSWQTIDVETHLEFDEQLQLLNVV